MRLKLLLTLVLCNLVWSLHPLFGKFALRSFTPFQVGWLRYLGACLTYLIFAAVVSRRPPERRPELLRQLFAIPRTRKDALQIAILGLAPFCISPLLQLAGLAQAQSIDNALIIAMEPLLTVLLAWIVLREALLPIHWLSFGLAISGFFLLTRVGGGELASIRDARFWGAFLMLMALWGEAIYSVLGRKLIREYSPVGLFGSAIVVGAIALTCIVLPIDGLPDFSGVRPESILALAYLGPLGTAASYIFWMIAVKDAPIASLAVTLFVQPLVGTFWGMFFLHENLSFLQWAGSALILTGIALQARHEVRSAPGREKS